MGSTTADCEEWASESDAATATASSSPSMRDFLRGLPKVELHAHLNGCVRESTLLELATERGVALCPRLFPSLQHSSKSEATAESRAINGSKTDADKEGASSADDQFTCTSGDVPLSPTTAAFYHHRPRSLADCFEVFVEIAKVVDDLVALRRITTEALQDFASEGTVYLELRTTPKRLLRHPRRQRHRSEQSDSESIVRESDPTHLDGRASKREYLDTILKAMDEFERRECCADQQLSPDSSTRSSSESPHPQPRRVQSDHRHPMRCRLLVAIDRSRPLEEAQEHVELAISLHGSNMEQNRRVVGIDVGGNPSKGDLRTFFPLLRRAREAGLCVTLHCAEIDCGSDDESTDGLSYAEMTARQEAEAILDHLEFVPDRLGHALLLPPRLQSRLLELGIPVETCPTSNVMTLELAHSRHVAESSAPLSSSIQDGLLRHPQLSMWLENNHPLAICTDDPGVFGTTLTREWELVLHTNASRLVRCQAQQEEEKQGRKFEMTEPSGHRPWGSEASLLRRCVAELMARTMDVAFCDAGIKDDIRKRILDFADDEG